MCISRTEIPRQDSARPWWPFPRDDAYCDDFDCGADLSDLIGIQQNSTFVAKKVNKIREESE
jgi:hypothetical protein